jgi:hypothetical protein
VEGSSARTKSATPGSTCTGPACTAVATASASTERNSSTCGAVAALNVRCRVGGRPANVSWGWTYHPAAVISSAIVNTSHDPSVDSATSVESGAATTCSSGISASPASSRSTPSSTCSVSAAYPSSPIVRTTAHAAASGPPDFVDCVVELSIVYPGQSALAKNCGRRSSAVRCRSSEAPLGV